MKLGPPYSEMHCQDWKSILIQIFELSNHWATKLLPNNEQILKEEKKANDEFLSKVKEAKEKFCLNSNIDNLTISDTPKSPFILLSEAMKQQQTYKEQMFQLLFSFYDVIDKVGCPPSPTETHNNDSTAKEQDFHRVQKELSKKLNNLKTEALSTQDELLECIIMALSIYNNIVPLVMTFLTIHYTKLNANNSCVDYKAFKYWLKISNSLSDIYAKVTNDHIHSQQNNELQFMYCLNLLKIEALRAKDEIDLLIVESCSSYALQLSDLLQDKLKHKYLSDIHFYSAVIAYKSKNYERLAYYLDILPDDVYPTHLAFMYAKAGKALSESNLKKALFYYQKSLEIFNVNIINKNHHVASSSSSSSSSSVLNTNDTISYLNPITEKTVLHAQQVAKIQHCLNDIKNKLCLQMRGRISHELPFVKIKKGPNDSELYLFVALTKIPPNADKIIMKSKNKSIDVRVYNNISKEKHYIGLQIVTKSVDADVVLKELSSLIEKFEKANTSAQEKTKDDLHIVEDKNSQEKLNSKKDETKQASGFIETSEEPYIKPEVKTKEKKKAVVSLEALSQVIPEPPVKECHASDFGFNVKGDPLVTPVYCSTISQKLRQAKMFVRWDGIADVDSVVESQFKGMLNPHPEGILTVGMYNQPGVKIWKNPDALGDDWNFCALRFKRKGASGFIRAVAKPENKIVVNCNGKNENRYLFALGKMKHK